MREKGRPWVLCAWSTIRAALLVEWTGTSSGLLFCLSLWPAYMIMKGNDDGDQHHPRGWWGLFEIREIKGKVALYPGSQISSSVRLTQTGRYKGFQISYRYHGKGPYWGHRNVCLQAAYLCGLLLLIYMYLNCQDNQVCSINSIPSWKYQETH